ncbi:hypothetical protein QBC33DRAFT_598608 [Phialemonium atrogriseum]|uniref:EthD domain-containing protein n=1 Tax=Phialemonium atrogriseum TaxID=1093897 RepID=A0AAJ0BRY7_9PEZI|nr:uncharacterized protein QBC33DRAFT_598608 [Phialemonium atrogriseum]KAK1763385.1 hypothetical protein QBC33DRAFT_598608 [Phialemonium atrogriseum]
MSNQGPSPSGPVPKPGRYLKISLYLRKQPNVTDAYFHAYWANNHLEPALKNKTFTDKTRRYNQHHVTPAEREQAKTLGIPVLEYDGIAEVWVDSLDDWKAIVSDTEFVNAVAADEPHFIMAPIHVLIGWDNLIIGDDWSPKGA